MKSLFCYLTVLICITACTSIKPTLLPPNSIGHYITEAKLHKLFKISPDDTLFINRSSYMPIDTVGKYFINAAGNYIARIDIVSPDGSFFRQTIIEALPDGSIIKKVPVWAGIYRCCWLPGVNDGLQQHGDYFSLPACGTGPGFCSGHLYFFKDVDQVEDNGQIFQSVWTGTLPAFYEYFIDIDGIPEVRNDTVIMHHTKRLLHLKGEKYKVKKSETFDVTYTLQSTGWTPTDSTFLKGIEEYLY